MLNNYEEVIRYNEETTSLKCMNYYKSKIKCAIFEKMGELEKSNNKVR